MLPIIDVVILLLLSGFFFYGLFFGAVRSLGNALGIFVGAMLALRYYEYLYSYVDNVYSGHPATVKLVMAFLIFSVFRKLIAAVFALADSALSLFYLVPGVGLLNRLLGLLFSLLTGVSVISLIVYAVSERGLWQSFLAKYLSISQFAPWLLKVSHLLLPYLSRAWEIFISLDPSKWFNA